jgi:hypothetical protein
MLIKDEEFQEMLDMVNQVDTDTKDNALTLTVIRRIKEILLKTLAPHIN